MSKIKRVCPACNKALDIINFRNESQRVQSRISPKNNILRDKNFCVACRKLKARGFLFIGAVEHKSKNRKNPYRSGNIWVIKFEVAKEFFDPNPLPKSGMAFIDVNYAHQIGLPDVNLNA